MIVELGTILNQYAVLLGRIPWWASLLFFAVHAVVIIICLSREGFHPFSSDRADRRNTVNGIIWLAVLAALPIVGIVMYLLGSVLPHFLWKKRHPSENIPFVFQPTLNQFRIPVIAGLAGVVIQFVIRQIAPNGAAAQLAFPFELAILCWTAILLLDWLRLRNRAVYLRLDADRKTLETAERIYGRVHHRESDVIVKERGQYRKEAAAARHAANAIFRRQTYSDALSEHSGEVTCKNENYSYSVAMTQRQFINARPDIVDTRYIGRGITRIIRAEWTEERDKCTELVLFRAVPLLHDWVIKSLSVLLVVFTLYTPILAEMHCAILQILNSI